MTITERVLNLLLPPQEYISGTPPVFLPDMTTWYDRHVRQGTLPAELAGGSLEEVCRSLGLPVWNPCTPWRVESGRVEVIRRETEGEKSTVYQYGGTALTARWTRGPDGDWWQIEYPVKTPEDLEIVQAYLEGRVFAADTRELPALLDRAGLDGLVVPRLPSRGFSWMMLEMLGWSDGLMVLLDAPEAISRLVELAEQQIAAFTRLLVGQAGRSGCRLFLSPDNLDGSFISPGYFERYLARGYGVASEACHEAGAFLMVHAGGPAGGLLEPLSRCGVDGIAGICGPPQGDTPVAEAREKAGPRMVFWGGIPQDILMDGESAGERRSGMKKLITECRRDGRTIIGIADHVPPDADMEGLRDIAREVALSS